ncbi:mitogen-activated protein kinase kinase kinase MLT-like [Elysia marginata]|uniref:Mitogen-activated protein kinase kinase kinase MLT-like n=1 Tax=Elysia marginata TaxID=1093978 RepID=A0AAV4G341_9GAST|nr:mitogen-activated protein kinase kinase kinase MLT-like [Elysia marginata]
MYLDMDVEGEEDRSVVTLVKDVSFTCKVPAYGTFRLTHPPYIMNTWCQGVVEEMTIECVITYEPTVFKPRSTRFLYQVDGDSPASNQKSVQLKLDRLPAQPTDSLCESAVSSVSLPVSPPPAAQAQVGPGLLHTPSYPSLPSAWTKTFFPVDLPQTRTQAKPPDLWASVVAGRKTSISKPIPGTNNVLFPDLVTAASSRSASIISRASSSRSTPSGSNSSNGPSKTKSSLVPNAKQDPDFRLDLSSLQIGNDKQTPQANENDSSASGNTSGRALKVAFKLGSGDSSVDESAGLQDTSHSYRLNSYADACRSPRTASSSTSQSLSTSSAHNARNQHNNRINSSQYVSSSKSSNFSHYSHRNEKSNGKWGGRGGERKRGGRGGSNYGQNHLEAIERPWTGRQISKAKSETNSHSQKDYPDNYRYRRAFSGGHTVSPGSSLDSTYHNWENGEEQSQDQSIRNDNYRKDNAKRGQLKGHGRTTYKNPYNEGHQQKHYERGHYMEQRGKDYNRPEQFRGHNYNGRDHYGEDQGKEHKSADKKWSLKKDSDQQNCHEKPDEKPEDEKDFSRVCEDHTSLTTMQQEGKTFISTEANDIEGFRKVKHGKGKHHHGL